MKISPLATYRLQLNKNFTFQDTVRITEYLKNLNISHLYLSPIFSSVPGSNHGYDATDFGVISEERGGEQGFNELAVKICSSDFSMKLIIDIVPNHMAANFHNKYWQDILKSGSKSDYWNLFDIRILESERIKLPILASELKDALSDFKIVKEKDETFLEYKEVRYPLNAASIEGLSDNPDILALLERQYYELDAWSNISSSISYRRFFDVLSLIAVRVEDKAIFDLTHKKIFDMLEQYPCIDGLRIDHIDGLADPKKYLDMLSEKTSSVWIEKILSREEDIGQDWKTQGTTGYEFIDRINQLCVHPENFNKIKDFWLKISNSAWQSFEDCVFDSKQQILKELFTPELERLVKLSCSDGGDIEKARTFWFGLTIGLQVYRIYRDDDVAHSEWIAQASKTARRLFDNYAEAEEIFMPLLIAPKNDDQKKAALEWQQLSGPVMAKGLEDTAHYRFTPLAALSEVGCSPVLNTTSKEDFIAWMQKRSARFPHAMNATSTHDTKRSEDTRHRLYALADMPDQWIAFYTSATLGNKKYNENNIIPPQVEYFIYQTLLGAWPLNNMADEDFEKRIHAYLQKALREGQQDTAWTSVNGEFEAAVNNFVTAILKDQSFLNQVSEYSKVLFLAGAINSLSVTTLKILSPGLPDIYQGSESWEFSLVDPDNRRPVDYNLRQNSLSEVDSKEKESGRAAALNYISENWQNGAVKIWLTRELLRIRQTYILNILDAKIELLSAAGRYQDNLIAYRIGNDASGLVVMCPRYPGILPIQDLKIDWQDTICILPDYSFHDLINNRPVTEHGKIIVNDLFPSLPISVLSYKKT